MEVITNSSRTWLRLFFVSLVPVAQDRSHLRSLQNVRQFLKVCNNKSFEMEITWRFFSLVFNLQTKRHF